MTSRRTSGRNPDRDGGQGNPPATPGNAPAVRDGAPAARGGAPAGPDGAQSGSGVMAPRASGGSVPAVPAPRQPALDTAAPIPDDPQALAEDIRQTRERLGEALEALVARTDVKALARAKAGRVSGRLRGMTPRAGRHAQGDGGQEDAGTPAASRVLPRVVVVSAAAGAVAVAGYLAATRMRQQTDRRPALMVRRRLPAGGAGPWSPDRLAAAFALRRRSHRGAGRLRRSVMRRAPVRRSSRGTRRLAAALALRR